MTGLTNWSLSLAGLGSLCWLASLLRVVPEEMRVRLGLLGAPFLAAAVFLSVLATAVAAAGRVAGMRRRDKAVTGVAKSKFQ